MKAPAANAQAATAPVPHAGGSINVKWGADGGVLDIDWKQPKVTPKDSTGTHGGFIDGSYSEVSNGLRCFRKVEGFR